MSDFSRHLPLSNRPRGDESAVTGDWRVELAAVIELAATLQPDDAASLAFAAEAKLAAEYPGLSLGELATAVRTGPRRRIRALTDGVRALFRLADGRAVALSPIASGAVALAEFPRMAFERRAAMRGSSVRATDAEWTVGRGPVRETTAREALEFILGLSDTPPPLRS